MRKDPRVQGVFACLGGGQLCAGQAHVPALQIFRHILQREFLGPSQSLSRKFTEWSYGPVRVSLYDLASVDSCEENSVLEIIAFHCQSPHRHRMVVLEPLNKLLQAKWNLLIPRFLFNFLCYLTYVSIFTAVTYHQPPLDKARQGGAHPGEASWKQPWQKMGQGLQPRPANADRRPDRLVVRPRRLHSWS
ncbi:hypothetical protein J1605_003535 [Eschrichtius robustus]|uniref:Uncharacterized protein n=1 Tax=Eschrichtius robustus TaxID=9764 RepID=A0AB34HQI2_ESCRO|nr:hypothetical protein J1605_003535 [Eschrichtius robustus]